MGLLHKRSWQQRLREFLRRPSFSEQSLDDLEDLLLEADMAPSLALGFTKELRRTAVQKKLGSEELLLRELAAQLESNLLAGGLDFEQKLRGSNDLQVIDAFGRKWRWQNDQPCQVSASSFALLRDFDGKYNDWRGRYISRSSD